MSNARDLSQLAAVAGTTSYSFRNKVINGAMEINQRGNTSTSVTSASNFHHVDRFLGTGRPSAGVFSLTQSNNAPPGFANSLFATVTTANTSLGTTGQYIIGHYIEGINTTDLNWGTANAAPVTLSFFVYSSVTGQHGGAIQNGLFNRSYPFQYNISTANTWEQKIITIPGDTTGSWYANNSTGIRIWFSLGTAYTGTANTWSGSYILAPTGSANVISTLGATFGLTGVQLEKGLTATPFERRPYELELQLCQRYWRRITVLNTTGSYQWVSGFGNSQAVSPIFPIYPQMRIKSSFDLVTTNTDTEYYSGSSAWTNTTASTYSYYIDVATDRYIGVIFSAAVETSGVVRLIRNNGTADLNAISNAELT